MKLAIGQEVASHDLVANVAAVVGLIEQAAQSSARLLLLSELFLGGYDLNRIRSGAGAIAPDDDRLDPIRAACAATGVSAIVGAVTENGGEGIAETPALSNSLLWFGADGSTRVVYRKTHLWHGEQALFAPGDHGVLVRFAGLKIGLGVCYDAGFPEFSRAYARAGADVVLFASAFAYGDERTRYRIYHPARALESGMFVAVSNALGSLGESEFFGESGVFDPFGRCIAGLGADGGLAIADVDPEIVASARNTLGYLNDLRNDYFPQEIDEEFT